MQELMVLITYIHQNKEADMDWFSIEPVNGGHSWRGRCWYIYNLVKYEFEFRFDMPATYPAAAPEIEIPELDGKTAKMYRGGKICLTIHFKPLWIKNSPRFGIAHALALGLGSWLTTEVPAMAEEGVIKPKV
jgi:ufm1-conjugating enzyme 1